MASATLNPDAVRAWKSERIAAHDRLAELAAKAATDPLSPAEQDEHRRLVLAVAQPLGSWLVATERA